MEEAGSTMWMGCRSFPSASYGAGAALLRTLRHVHDQQPGAHALAVQACARASASESMADRHRSTSSRTAHREVVSMMARAFRRKSSQLHVHYFAVARALSGRLARRELPPRVGPWASHTPPG
eukprot:6201979-Pleurochrysis_carterae.AAC.1